MTQPAPLASASNSPVWHNLEASAAAAALETDVHQGLAPDTARERLERYGRNELEEGARRTLLQRVLDQFKDVVIWVLLAAVVISALLGDITDAIVIVAIVVLNAVLGVVQESKAEQSLAALKRMSAPRARVVRGGRITEVPSPELVPGDLVLLEAGNLVPADLRLVEAVNLGVEEASLTGESVPVEKEAGVTVAPDAPLGDRHNMAFAGTTVARGRGKGLVAGTGTHTEMGTIARLLGEIEAEKTPLQERLEGLGRWLAVLVLVVSAIVFIAGWLRGAAPVEMLLTAISLAVAAIPEGLPAIVTIVLALGMSNMVRRHVVVRRLRAVEALGSTTVICTDKTGTLTQNRMTVRRFWAAGQRGTLRPAADERTAEFLVGDEPRPPAEIPGLCSLLEVAVLCNDAVLRDGKEGRETAGDPTETALLTAAAYAGLYREELEREAPRHAEIPFDSTRKRMTTLHPHPQDGFRILVKGAPDEVLRRCGWIEDGDTCRALTDEDRARIRTVAQEFAGEALRLLAFACRAQSQPPPSLDAEGVESDLLFLGLVGMLDPPRAEAAPAIQVCHHAGIRPIMITGDYAVTARTIADELGLDPGGPVLAGAELRALEDDALREKARGTSVFARVSPSDKLRIVEALQKDGQIVAMTGDGVNDAPALKRADIGVAMGITGTDVATGAADIVLTDDNFASIVAAVEEGRRIFDNIRKFVYYLLSCNISEVLTLFVAIMIGLPQPLLAVQLLWVNLVTDGLPALALGMEPTEPGIMRRPPRDPREGVLNRQTLASILTYGAYITVVTLAAYGYALYSHCLAPQGFHGWAAVEAALKPGFWKNPALEGHLVHARTLAFGMLAFSQLAHALNCRSDEYSLFQLRIWTNPHLLAAIALSVVAQLLVIYLPLGNAIFHTAPVRGQDLLVGIILSASPLLFGELRKLLIRRLRRPNPLG